MKQQHEKFVTFILTHGRADNVRTYPMLRRLGYTGKVIVLIDDEDSQRKQYEARFAGEPNTEVRVFNKAAIAETFDPADQGTDRRSVVYARNACINIAREDGYDYLLQLDDDYGYVAHRWAEPDGSAPQHLCWDLDETFDRTLDFLDDTGAAVVAYSQGGDHFGGLKGIIKEHLRRKAMNALFMRADTDLRFVGRINEDVNTYVTAGSRGVLFLTVMRLQIQHGMTQQAAGGMTDLYANAGTYVKSFYTVMMQPSSVRLRLMGTTGQRIHHGIDWTRTVPMILSDRYRKPRESLLA